MVLFSVSEAKRRFGDIYLVFEICPHFSSGGRKVDLVIHEKNPLRTVPVDRCGSPRFAGGTVIDICQNLAIIKVNRGIFKEGDF